MATLGERILEAVGIAPAARLQEVAAAGSERAARAYEAGYNEGLMDGNDEPSAGTLASYGYKAVKRGGGRDWTKVSRQEMVEAAWALYVSSQIGKRCIHLKRDHLIGRETAVQAPDPDLQELLDTFWRDNQLRRRLPSFVAMLYTFGEQCYTLHVRESDGRVRLGYVDPATILEVVSHPGNSLDRRVVIVGPETNKRAYRIATPADTTLDADGEAVEPDHPGRYENFRQANKEPWEEVLLRELGREDYAGDCAYIPVNTAPNSPRGFSDLLPAYDWIIQADEVLFALAEREQFAGYFSFDVTIKGDQTVVDDYAKANRNPPKRGSINFHNDSVEWQVFAPDLNQVGSIETFRALLGLILGGMGFPVHWFGFGDDANRATATAQGDPAHRSLEHDQGVIQDLILTLCEFARDQAIITGATFEDESIDVLLPELSSLDLARVAQSFLPILTGAMTAEDAGYLDRDTALAIMQKLLKELDIEYDPAAIAAAVEQLQQDTIDDEQVALAQRLNRTNGNLS